VENMEQVGVKVKLKKPEDFLLVRETLTRIGIAPRGKKVLYQSAHILHKRGEYYICNFKELFLLDGKKSTITDEDYERRNLIVDLLEGWGLIDVVDEWFEEVNLASMSTIKIIPHSEKNDWILEAKYTLGAKKWTK
jgi:hypothetical protein